MRATNWEEVPLLLTINDLRKLFGFARDYSYMILHTRGRRIGGRWMVRKEELQKFLAEKPGEEAA